MDRRRFVMTLLAGALAAPGAAGAQQASKVFRVGLVSVNPLSNFSDPTNMALRAFRAELRDRGYVEGQNLILELRSVDGKIEHASGMIADLVRLGVDVILATGPEMVREAKRVTTAVPIVMFSRAPVVSADGRSPESTEIGSPPTASDNVPSPMGNREEGQRAGTGGLHDDSSIGETRCLPV